MKKWINKKSVLPTIVALLPILLGVALYNKLPSELPTHWDFSGEINDYSSKAFVVFGLPILMAVAGLTVQFGLEQDPKKANMSSALKTLVIWMCPLLSLILVPITLYIGMGNKDIPISLITCIIVGVTFIIIGNYLPKCKQSYTMGIRLPWTLNSEENWNRTHRFAGKLWIIGGLLFFVCGFIAQYMNRPAIAAITFAFIMVTAFIPAVYSFILYKKGI